MCGTACNDPRCALYCGPVFHEGIFNPSNFRAEVKYANCYNAELERRVCNQKPAPCIIKCIQPMSNCPKSD